MSQRMVVEVQVMLSRNSHTKTILRSIFNDVTRKSNIIILLSIGSLSNLISSLVMVISLINLSFVMFTLIIIFPIISSTIRLSKVSCIKCHYIMYIRSCNHKRIGIYYLLVSLCIGFQGTYISLLMRI